MRDIYLDLLHRKRPISKASWLLLATGIALLLAVILADAQGQSALSEALQRSGDAMRQQQALMGSSSRNNKDARTTATIDPPWQTLLSTLERTKPKDISLMQLEADGGVGSATIVGEASNPDAMLAYLAALNGESGLQQVTLTQHMGGEASPTGAIRFTVRLGWGSR